ncbi:hypothetical protein Cfla_1802 [Cellulomonas flavigena DSM 20109]|uniref:AbiEi antitoxin C-terminal domain-containing protein n=1 Tax=Cellulomonas flavigena (strain ATCC 482 / DSM 20109 / BCRC 11376 / JCM 18109 / NBRC 3775 / NCIMB 8073 / NRS 134) TaxID=446466 RepID=D5UEN9_CELFN|nr:hypothetical protein Cfla_1802 [Cellulomonas flavigena DSM 20109]
MPVALRRLRPPPAAAPGPVVRRDEVPPWTWTGLHLDGALVPLWRDTARVAGVPEDAAVRAAAFAALVPRRGAVGRLAAAWVHAGGPPPARVTVLVRSGARRPAPHPDRTTAEAELADDDLETHGGVLVTTVTATAVDVARWVPTATAVRVLRSLLPCGLDPTVALRRLESHSGGRGLRAARVALGQVGLPGTTGEHGDVSG